ncbi:hypothetical protein HBN50_05285 [Halobacteriovorax sp. GB3]|uniref:hypothetical protein n=1 Tax=Halobacteriovorax sp. GB3 TaxID=2719615 RepID=UPI00235DC4DD|nr:hypothetical protein [Halobacteriovorax sp. GB3]MDD0852499.1 hypothetical protein [Halobacteriovorax sp. GB3]
MKKLIAALAIIVSTSTFAQKYFGAQALCLMTGRDSAQCEVCNNYAYSIGCKMRSEGITLRGYRVANEGYIIIRPGQCGMTYVKANNSIMDPLVDAVATATCHF